MSQGNRFILSVHFIRFVVLKPIKDKAARTIVRHLIERVFSVFGPPETLHSDQGKEFENELVKELQSVFGYKKTRTAAFRPQGNSVLERAHSTVHNMLAMYSNLSFDNWAELLPFVQLAHNTAYSTTSRKLRISCCLDVQLYCLSISSSEFRPPPHRKISSTIPNKLSKTCN